MKQGTSGFVAANPGAGVCVCDAGARVAFFLK
jgi:hypothetical protein